MQNEEGKNIDLYIPRKCSWTSRLITAKDHASVQIAIGELDPVSGVYTKKNKSFALSGFVRFKGMSDEALTALAAAEEKA